MARSRRPKSHKKLARQPGRWGAPLNEAARARGFTGTLFTVADGRVVGKLPPPGYLVAGEGDMVKVLTHGTFGADCAIVGTTSLFRAAGPVHAFQPLRLVPTRDSLATVTARRKGSPVGVALPPVLQIDADMRPLARRPGFWEANGIVGPPLPPRPRPDDDEPARPPQDHGFYTAITAFLFDVDPDVVAPTQEARAVRICEELAAGEACDSLPSRTAAIPLRRILALDALLAQPCVRTPGELPAPAGETCANCDAELLTGGGFSYMGESAQCADCYKKRWPKTPLKPARAPATPPPPLAAAMIAAGMVPGDPIPSYPPPIRYDKTCPSCGKDLSRGPTACADPVCIAKIAERDRRAEAAAAKPYPTQTCKSPRDQATELVDEWMAKTGTVVKYGHMTDLIMLIAGQLSPRWVPAT